MSFYACKLSGGLGNQLFQIFAAAKVAFEMNLPLKCIWAPQGTPRKCQNNVIFHVAWLSEEECKRARVYKEPNESQFRELPRQANTLIEGYFQHKEYFSNSFQAIANRLKIQIPSESCPGTVVHIRRTDFLEKPHFHTTLGEDQYAKQLQDMQRPLTIVTDDNSDPFVLDMKHKLDATLFEGSDIESFWFLSRHDMIVCANSTFSQWAARFALFRNPKTRVSMPEKFTPVSHTQTL